MTGPWVDRVRGAYAGPFAAAAAVEPGFGPVAVDVPAVRWVEALTVARDVLGCRFFDWLSAVDESSPGSRVTVPGDPRGEFRVVCHLAARRTPGVEHLVVRTLLAEGEPLHSAAGVFAGARWHERETAEMFGIGFTEGGDALPLDPLLLPEEFEGHPLRKSFLLAARLDREWPGAKEPGESDASGPAAGRTPRSRRRARPHGVPEPGQETPR